MTNPPAGLRERRRIETRRTIAEAALALFATHGYEATTLDAIAAAAGISRRTFFHYFKSKDDILLSLQDGLGEAICAALTRSDPGETPLAAARRAITTVAGGYSQDMLQRIDPIMRRSEAVQARKNASYINEETMLLAGLQQLWPERSGLELRLVASESIAAARIALDTWTAEGGARPLPAVLTEAFQALEAMHRP